MASTTAKPDGFWTSRIKAEGLGGAVKKGAEDIGKGINVFDKATEGHRGLAFARVAGTGAGLAIAAGALQSKDAEGNDRSALARVGQAVLGTGLAVGSLALGRGR